MTATLLLADDSSTIQRVVELTFAGEDVEVVAVGDADAAIARLESAPPDIVLADVDMPGMSGYDIAKFVKQHGALAHIPVILLTGAFEPVDQARVAAAGCDAVLAKPFEPQLMITRVKELLDARPASAVQAPPPRRPDLDAYFDQLDAAFANLSAAGTGRSAAPDPEAPPDAPLSYASPEADFERGAAAPRGDDPAPAAPLATAPPPAPPPVPPPAPPTPALPSLADAFAALLAAEQRGDAPPPPWPATAAPAAVLDEDAIASIAARVAARLSDQFLRGVVPEIVASTAERLVREEIERIKASIL